MHNSIVEGLINRLGTTFVLPKFFSFSRPFIKLSKLPIRFDYNKIEKVNLNFVIAEYGEVET